MNVEFDILLVEDEQVVNESAAKILKHEGYSVDQVFDGEAAVRSVESNNYKLIITDLMLKEFSGINLIELIKKKYYHIPVIMITGYATITNVFEAFSAGAFDYIPKPFTYDELLSVVNRAVGYFKNPDISERAYNFFVDNRPGKSLDKLYSMGNHSWVYFEDDGSAIVGLGKTFAAMAKEIINIEFTNENEDIIQGNLLIQLIGEGDSTYRVWAPISGNVIKNNTSIIENIQLIKSETYINQWLTRIRPDNLDKELIYLTPFSR